MKSLRESLFDSNTQMTESLFDNDLVSKDISINEIIKILNKYLDIKMSESDWENCLQRILKSHAYSSAPKFETEKRKFGDILSKNSIYIRVERRRMYLFGYDILGPGLQYITCNWFTPDFPITTAIWTDIGSIGAFIRNQEYSCIPSSPQTNKQIKDILKHKTYVSGD